ncbi:MAG: protein DA1 [Spirochaetales bacterium]|nr:protein DA1 [Spirochaetales bacterium]
MQPICTYCGRPIIGKYLKDYWGNSYCAEHIKAVPQCDYCGRLISPKTTRGGKTYSDGRRICGICLPKAVTENQTGRELLGKVHDLLEETGIMIQPFKPDFALISRSRLKQLDRRGGEKQGFATFKRRMVKAKITSFKMEIFILNGLPESSFISTCAHELMHIWFYSRNITDASPALIEGSCNMAAYLILKKQGTLEAEYLIKGLFEDKNKIYGAGFRKIQKLTDKRGTSGWLEYAIKHKRI